MLRIYNTLSQKKEIFKPLTLRQARGKQKKVRPVKFTKQTFNRINLFVCGPTVYDFSHIGHARTYIAFDAIVKYLRQAGYNVFYLQNITDIDDKIIIRAKEKNISPKNLAVKFEKEYLQDMQSLKVNSVSKYAQATAHIEEIISQVNRLLKKGYAYTIKNDGIYYDISKFKSYGKLSKRTALQAEDAVSRIDETKAKKNRGDFCLWKFSKNDEPQWPSPWGKGRPGWHIEDTAITEKYFGSQYDIHGGARDLIFPHHEAEISQMEAISGKSPLVRYWMHSGFLTVNNQKMSKSLGNFITIKDFLSKNSGRILRFLILKHYYRSPLDYNDSLAAQTKHELARLDEFITKLEMQSPIRTGKAKQKTTAGNTKIIKNLVSRIKKEFDVAMQDDFNTPRAIAAIFQLVNKGNSFIARNKLDRKSAKDILGLLKKYDEFFDFIFWQESKVAISEDILSLAKERERYRKSDQWKEADLIRDKINQLGYQIEDTPKGPKIKKMEK